MTTFEFTSSQVEAGFYRVQVYHPMSVKVKNEKIYGKKGLRDNWYIQFERGGKIFRAKHNWERKGPALEEAKRYLGAYVEQEMADAAAHRMAPKQEAPRQNEIPFRQASMRMSKKEALEVLGLTESASKDDVKKKHRALTRLAHPDAGGSNFLMVQINLAKDVLDQYM